MRQSPCNYLIDLMLGPAPSSHAGDEGIGQLGMASTASKMRDPTPDFRVSAERTDELASFRQIEVGEDTTLWESTLSLFRRVAVGRP